MNTKGETHIVKIHVMAKNAVLCCNLQFHDQKIANKNNNYALHDGQTYLLVQVSMNFMAVRG